MGTIEKLVLDEIRSRLYRACINAEGTAVDIIKRQDFMSDFMKLVVAYGDYRRDTERLLNLPDVDDEDDEE